MKQRNQYKIFAKFFKGFEFLKNEVGIYYSFLKISVRYFSFSLEICDNKQTEKRYFLLMIILDYDLTS